MFFGSETEANLRELMERKPQPSVRPVCLARPAAPETGPHDAVLQTENARLLPGWWILPGAMFGLVTWVWLGVMLVSALLAAPADAAPGSPHAATVLASLRN